MFNKIELNFNKSHLFNDLLKVQPYETIFKYWTFKVHLYFPSLYRFNFSLKVQFNLNPYYILESCIKGKPFLILPSPKWPPMTSYLSEPGSSPDQIYSSYSSPTIKLCRDWGRAASKKFQITKKLEHQVLSSFPVL